MYLQYLFVCVAVVANFCIFYDLKKKKLFSDNTLYVADQPEGDCPCKQWAEQELLQQQRLECVCCWGASQDKDGTKSSWERCLSYYDKI